MKPRENDNSWLGNMNAASLGKLYLDGKVVGTCADTPNAIAYGMNKTDADSFYSPLMGWKFRKDMLDRVKNAGWFACDKQAHFTKR